MVFILGAHDYFGNEEQRKKIDKFLKGYFEAMLDKRQSFANYIDILKKESKCFDMHLVCLNAEVYLFDF